jgi:lysophospholipase L1-like esterase
LTPGSGDNLPAEALVLNPPDNGEVVFSLDGGSEIPAVGTGNLYSVQFTGIADGEHEVVAVLNSAQGEEVSADINSTVGTGGDYYITVGDSITNGVGDFNPSNNDSADGRIVSIQGYQAKLADDLTTRKGRPQIFFNEGIGGDKASDLDSRIFSILDRHPRANKVLLMIGTNDSASGDRVDPDDFQTTIESITNKLNVDGKSVWLPRTLPTNPPGQDPIRDDLIQQYNTKIVAIANADSGDDIFLGPNFYSSFFNNPTRYADNLHPNDTGYQLMSSQWNSTLP